LSNEKEKRLAWLDHDRFTPDPEAFVGVIEHVDAAAPSALEQRDATPSRTRSIAKAGLERDGGTASQFANLATACRRRPRSPLCDG